MTHADDQIHRDIGQLIAEVRTLKDEVTILRKQQAQMNESISRAKGALPILLAVGGGLGWLIANGHKILDWLRA